MLILALQRQIGELIETRVECLIKYTYFTNIQFYRDAGIREAECERSAMDVKYSTDTKIEDNSRMYKLQKAHFDQEINTAVSFLQMISTVS